MTKLQIVHGRFHGRTLPWVHLSMTTKVPVIHDSLESFRVCGYGQYTGIRLRTRPVPTAAWPGTGRVKICK